MDNINRLKEKFAQDLRRLSLRERREFLKYVKALLAEGQSPSQIETFADLDPGKDPLLNFIGGVSHGTLAKNIDEEL